MKEKEETFISYIFRYSSYSSKKKKIKFSYKHFQEESLRTLSMETLENIKLFSSPNPSKSLDPSIFYCYAIE